MKPYSLGRQTTMRVTRESRKALSRARFFLAKADQCSAEDRLEFEAFLEAAMVFARSALLRLEAKYKKHPRWKPWWSALKANPDVEFFRTERNWIVPEAAPRLGHRGSSRAPARQSGSLGSSTSSRIPAFRLRRSWLRTLIHWRNSSRTRTAGSPEA